MNHDRAQIADVMLRFFEKDGWTSHWVDDLPVLCLSFAGKHGSWTCYAQAREEQEQFVFYSACPVNVPYDRLPHAAEFITRANYGLVIGNFEMDYSDGEIRFKTSADVEGDRLTLPLIQHLVYANVITMDRYLPGIMNVLHGKADPATEIARIEDTSSRSDFEMSPANPQKSN